MAHLDKQTKVLIIGAGVSGLALAQILRRHGIEFEIFERDDGLRNQGWSLGLDKCLAELTALLPQDLGDIRQSSPNYSIGKKDAFAIFDGQTHELMGVVGNQRDDDHFINVNRRLLRNILLQHIKVQWSKRLTSYTQSEGIVTVLFEDGTSATGNILVGADGANSIVRRQLLNGFEATPSRAIMLHGDVVLSKDDYTPILEKGSSGVLFGGPRVKAYAIIMEWLKDGTGLFNWSCAYTSDNLTQDLEWTQAASQESLFERAQQWMAHLPPFVRKVVDQTGPNGMHQPPIKLMETVLPVDRLSGQVTLLGDSAHSMVPFRGMGANSALLDTCSLARGIIQGIGSGQKVESVLRAFEESMIPPGRANVLESREIAEATESPDISGGRVQQQGLTK